MSEHLCAKAADAIGELRDKLDACRNRQYLHGPDVDELGRLHAEAQALSRRAVLVELPPLAGLDLRLCSLANPTPYCNRDAGRQFEQALCERQDEALKAAARAVPAPNPADATARESPVEYLRRMIRETRSLLLMPNYRDMETGRDVDTGVPAEEIRDLWNCWRSCLPNAPPPEWREIRSRDDAQQALDELGRALDRIAGSDANATREGFQGTLTEPPLAGPADGSAAANARPAVPAVSLASETPRPGKAISNQQPAAVSVIKTFAEQYIQRVEKRFACFWAGQYKRPELIDGRYTTDEFHSEVTADSTTGMQELKALLDKAEVSLVEIGCDGREVDTEFDDLKGAFHRLLSWGFFVNASRTQEGERQHLDNLIEAVHKAVKRIGYLNPTTTRRTTRLASGIAHDPDIEDDRRAEGLRRAAVAAAQRRQAAQSVYYRFCRALDAHNALVLELSNRPGRLDAAAIRPELVMAVADVIATAKPAGAWPYQWPEVGEDDPHRRRAVRVFELVDAGKSDEALDLLKRMPEAACWLSELANKLHDRIDPLLVAKAKSSELLPGPQTGPEDRHTAAADTPKLAMPTDPVTLGQLLLAEYQRKGEKPTVKKLAVQVGVLRQALYEDRRFAPLRDMANKLFGLFGREAKKGDRRGPRGTKDRGGNLDAEDVDQEPIEDKAVD